MSGQPVRVEVGRRSALITGSSKVVVPAIKLARSPRQWVGERRGWSVPIQYLDDVLAILEYQFRADIYLVDVGEVAG